MKTAGLRLTPLFALAALSASAHSTLIDFNSLTGSDQSYYTDFDSTVSSNGYLFDATDLVAWKPGLGLTDCGGNYTGTNALFMNFRDDSITLHRADSAAFNLLSLDVANLFLQSSTPFSDKTSTITFTGHYFGGGTVVQSYTTLADDLLHTVNFSGFSNLSSVTWSQDDAPYHQFDNVVVTTQAVPEPATVAALGLGALGLLKRRRRA